MGGGWATDHEQGDNGSNVMHMSCVVLVPETADVEKAVAEALAEHEEWYDEATSMSGGWWDWYRIGGRWDGAIRGLDQHCTDNNDCHYSAAHESIERNALPVREYGEWRPYRFVVAGESTAAREEWDGDNFVDQVDYDKLLTTALLTHRDWIAVGVDYHS